VIKGQNSCILKSKKTLLNIQVIEFVSIVLVTILNLVFYVIIVIKLGVQHNAYFFRTYNNY